MMCVCVAKPKATLKNRGLVKQRKHIKYESGNRLMHKVPF
jgi:hypothetical protein